MTSLNVSTIPLFLGFLLLPVLSYGQRTQPYFHHLTTQDGLPSSETYCAVQDKDGYMWIGTDNGVARFDGYEFEVFGAEEGLEDEVVFNIVEDEHGTLWFQTYSGRVFYFKGNRFYPYRHNARLIQLRRKYWSISLLHVLTDGSLIIKQSDSDLLKLLPSGEVQLLLDSVADQFYIYAPDSQNHGCLAKKSTHSIKNVHELTVFFHRQREWQLVSKINLKRFFGHEPNKIAAVSCAAYREDTKEAIVLAGNQIYYQSQSGIHLSAVATSNVANFILPNHDGGFWIAMGRSGGLLHCYQRNGQLVVDKSLGSTSISNLSYDRNGGLWACSGDNGIFYSVNHRQNTYTHNIESRSLAPLALQMLKKNRYLASYNNTSILEHDFITRSQNTWKQISKMALNVSTMYFDSVSNSTYAREILINHATNSTTSVYNVNPQHYVILNYLKRDLTNEERLLFFNSSKRVGTINLDAGLRSLQVNYVTNSNQPEISAYGIDIRGRNLIGTFEGLFQIGKNGELERIQEDIPALHSRISSIDNLMSGGTLISTRGRGIIHLANSNPKEINQTEGLISSQILGIHQTIDSAIWIHSLQGLNKLSLDHDGNILELRSYTTQHGLPSNEIHYVTSYGENIWLATRSGIVNFVEVPFQDSSTLPEIRSFYVNGKTILPDSINIPPGENDLKITFNTINFQMLGDIPYRYRIRPEEDWQYTKNRTVEYPNLAAASYQFEVQSQNRDGVHSLKEEIEMLNIYLSLEKLRFKDSFDYVITVEEHLPQADIHIAPMLVQPFVENAILHGMADVTSGGMITIHFSGSPEDILAKIEDNGSGFDSKTLDKKDSMGVKITRQRLTKNLPRGAKTADRLIIEPAISSTDHQQGTRVLLRIRPKQIQKNV